METRLNGSNWREGMKNERKNFLMENIKKTRIQSAVNYREKTEAENKKGI